MTKQSRLAKENRFFSVRFSNGFSIQKPDKIVQFPNGGGLIQPKLNQTSLDRFVMNKIHLFVMTLFIKRSRLATIRKLDEFVRFSNAYSYSKTGTENFRYSDVRFLEPHCSCRDWFKK
jgi:hypothetical protein